MAWMGLRNRKGVGRTNDGRNILRLNGWACAREMKLRKMGRGGLGDIKMRDTLA